MSQSVEQTVKKAESWNNFKAIDSGMDRYGPQRLELAKYVRDEIFGKIIKNPNFIESGTLLGAYRNGKYIPHDDDFDYAILFEETESLDQLKQLLVKIKEVLPKHLDARLVTTYTEKIEIFQPEFGFYQLKSPLYNGADYCHVTVDIQTYNYKPEKRAYETTYKLNPSGCDYLKSDVFPLKQIQLEGEMFNAPDNVEGALTAMYGCIAPGAKFNMKTGKYDPPQLEQQQEQKV